MILLRVLQDSDYPAVCAIREQVFPAKYSLEFDHAWSIRDRDSSRCLVDEIGDLLGFVLVTATDPTVRSIEFIGTHPSAQASGLGTRLLRSVLADCDRDGFRATLIPVNDPRVIRWYTGHGFCFDGAPFVSPWTGDLEERMIYRAQGKVACAH